MKKQLLFIGFLALPTCQLTAHCFSPDVAQNPDVALAAASCYQDQLTALTQSDDAKIKKEAQDLLAAIQKGNTQINDTQQKLVDASQALDKSRQDNIDLAVKIRTQTLTQEALQRDLASNKIKAGTACATAGKWLKAHQYELEWKKASTFAKFFLALKYHCITNLC